MAKRLPPLNPLKTFEATARHLSVIRASAELGVTHSAVTHQIRALEASLGVKLFKREGRRLSMTQQGAALLPTVSHAFETIAETAARVCQPSTEGELAISCRPAFLSFWLIPRLGTFTSTFPNVKLRLSPSHHKDDIYSEEVDVCIRYGAGNWPDCWVQLLSHIQLFPVISPTLMNKRPLRSRKDLDRHVILHADGGKEWMSWLAASRSVQVYPERQHFVSDAQLAMEAAIYGHGVALGDNITAAGLLSSGRLVAPFDTAVPCADGFFVVCRTGMQSAPIVRAFIDWLFSQISEDGSAVVKPTSPH